METKNLNEYAEAMYRNLEGELVEIKTDTPDMINQAEMSVKAVGHVLKMLKEYVLGNDFENPAEEIHFFKHIKPQFYSLLIFFVKVFSIETERPTGSDEVQQRYLQRELSRLTHFFDNNMEFYKYFRSDANHLDEKYFLRGQFDIRLSVDAFYYDADPRFSTSRDYKVAKILANEKLQVYLNTALQQLNSQDGNTETVPIPLNGQDGLNWTASKASLIELLYGLHSVGAINHGRLSLKELAEVLEKMFHLSLGEYYRTFLEIRIRKKNRTLFLDQMRDMLIKRMDDADVNPKN